VTPLEEAGSFSTRKLAVTNAMRSQTTSAIRPSLSIKISIMSAFGIIRHKVVALACKAEQEIDSGKIIDVDRAAIQSDTAVVGRFLVTKNEADIASFKTPGLRNVLITAPYFHDGSQATLWDVLDQLLYGIPGRATFGNYRTSLNAR
jgi:hypothetical protein